MKANSQRQALPNHIGLFGGTFNPIHLGHTQVAREVLRRFELDRIYFIPCALPPHKMQGPLAPAPSRLEMIHQALQDTPQLAVSDIEVQRPGPSYTIDTLREFSTRTKNSHRLFFLLGLDAFLELHTWKAFRHILDITAVIIMSRPIPDQPKSEFRKTAVAYARHHLSDQYLPSDDGYVLRHPTKRSLYLAKVTPMDIASSKIRDRIGRGATWNQWVAPAVAQYIDQKGLYR